MGKIEDQKAEIVIVGETHLSLDHKAEERRLVEQLKPKYLLLEALDNFRPTDPKLARYLSAIGSSTLKDVASLYGFEADSSTFNEKLLRKMRKSSIGRPSEYSIYPSSTDQLAHTPMFLFSREAFDLVESGINYELLANGSDGTFEKARSHMQRLSVLREKESYEKARLLVTLEGIKAGAVIAGCDINKKDVLKGLDIREARKYVEKLMGPRDEEMARKILEYHSQGSSDRPTLAIVGRDHITGIQKRLADTDANARFITLQGDHGSREEVIDYFTKLTA